MDKPLTYCSRNIRFCSEHFEQSMFMNDKKDKLTPFAEPTLFNIPNPPRKLITRRPIVKHELQKDEANENNLNRTISHIEMVKASEMRKKKANKTIQNHVIVAKLKRALTAKKLLSVV